MGEAISDLAIYGSANGNPGIPTRLKGDGATADESVITTVEGGLALDIVDGQAWLRGDMSGAYSAVARLRFDDRDYNVALGRMIDAVLVEAQLSSATGTAAVP